MSGTAITLKNAFVAIGPADNTTEPTNISCQVTQITINLTSDVREVTPVCETAKTKIVGLKDSTFSLEANQDFADNGFDEFMFNAYNLSTELSIHVRPSASAVGVANPAYTANVFVSDYSPFSGQSTGEEMKAPVSFASNGNVTRLTA